MDARMLFAIVAGTLLVLAFTLLPAMIAQARRHPDRATIWKLSPGGLFSFMLWFALMAWAVGGKRDDSVIGRYAHRLQSSGWLLPIALVLVVLGAGSAWLLVR